MIPAAGSLVSLLQRSGIGVRPRDWRLPLIETYPWVVALVQTYAFYCVVLAAGIIISQIRARKPDPNTGW